MTPQPKSNRRLTPPSLEDAKVLRSFFDEAGYNLDTLRGGLGFTDLASFRYRKYLLARNADPSRLDVIVQWFTCGMPVSVEKANRAIPARVIGICEACGLLFRDGDSLVPVAMLSPFQGMIIASDLISKLDEDASDLIVWPNATTYQILNAAIRSKGGAMLDLGCGTGAVSVACASQFSSITATDLNARAAEFTAFNARLNSADLIECLIGDGFAPVAGRKFDLILCNPPFFLVPSTGLMYCENPMELDAFARSLVRQAPAYLNESGFFQMMCEWVDLTGIPWRDRLREWGEGLGCDVLILKTYTMTPIAYGKERCEQRPGNRSEGDAAFAQWVDYYREKKVEMVHGGMIVLRRREGNNWIRIDDDPTFTLAHPAGDQILEGFAAQDLIGKSDQELLGVRLRLLDHARLRQILRREGPKFTQTRLTLSATAPRSGEVELAPLVAEFVGRFDGARTLGELILDLAGKVEAEPSKVASECVEITRKLLERGFLGNAIE